jgi:predicted ATPase with chaperone activity
VRHLEQRCRRAVSVEIHVSSSLPGFTIVGLPDAAVREVRDRVRAALLSGGLAWPKRMSRAIWPLRLPSLVTSQVQSFRFNIAVSTFPSTPVAGIPDPLWIQAGKRPNRELAG